MDHSTLVSLRDRHPAWRLLASPHAPRGVPQIEVTFDIDANGILNVTAKDKGTGKEQKVKVEVGSGLSKEEVERMAKDAERFAAEDKRRREVVDLKNQADSTAYQAEKTLKEAGDKVDAALKAELESKIQALRKAAEGEDKDAIQAALSEFEQLQQKLYQQAGAPDAGAAAGAQAGASAGASTGADEDIKDADFEVK